MSLSNFKKATLAALAICASFCANSVAEAANLLRAPAIPLIAHDPYFSVWSNTDGLADSFPVHWTGKVNALTSYVAVDGQNFRIMGNPVEKGENAPKMEQKDCTIYPTNTVYTFEGAGVRVKLTFTNPMLPDDLMLLSRPATYLTWDVKPIDGKPHNVKLYFDVTAELCVNTVDQKVVARRDDTELLDVMRIGSLDQPILAKSGDDIRIDWGYLYSCVEKGTAQTAIASSQLARTTFLAEGVIPAKDDEDFPRQARDKWPVLATLFDCGEIPADATAKKRIVVAYDDQYCLTFLGRRLKPYWRKDGLTAHAMLDLAATEYDDVVARCEKFDAELVERAKDAGGALYADLCAITYAEVMAASKLAVLPNGRVIYPSKENFSNGCGGTVDLVYPTGPFYAVLNNELLKHTLTCTMEYAVSGRWKWPFSPHDEGQYPLLNGQVYGGGERSEENQMPVEESANMLILLDVICRADNNVEYALQYWDTFKMWAEYLLEKGLDPENQLCTDDFAGHLAHNANLSAKAIVALGAYADVLKLAGKDDDAKRYRAKAEEFAKEWKKLAFDGDHYKLAFDREGTWSQKYNLVWDKLLDLNLFEKDIVETEVKYYKTKLNQYGLPLDNRSDYTKLDWEAWTATLANTQEDFDALMAPVYEFVNATQPRVPLTDWYYTSTAKQVGFQARSVVGGVYIKMMEKK